MVDDDDIDGVAAEYVLGSLDAGERKKVAARRKIDAALDIAINAWEARLEPLSDLLPGIAPPPRLFSDIEKRLFEPEELQAALRARVRPRRWLALAAGASALAACLVLAMVWLAPNSSASPARLYAELQRSIDAANGTPTVPLGFVVHFDLRASTMLVNPLAVPPGSRRDYQLWLIPTGSSPPKQQCGGHERGQRQRVKPARAEEDQGGDPPAVTGDPQDGHCQRHHAKVRPCEERQNPPN